MDLSFLKKGVGQNNPASQIENGWTQKMNKMMLDYQKQTQ